jgi:hypothetical protein
MMLKLTLEKNYFVVVIFFVVVDVALPIYQKYIIIIINLILLYNIMKFIVTKEIKIKLYT